MRAPQTEAEAGETLILGAFLPYRISTLAESVSRAFARHYAQRFGLTIAEWRVMSVLGEGVPQSTQDVIGRTRMDRVRVSRAAIRLVDKGLIIRVTQPGDQRALTLRLSRRGQAMYRQIVPFAHTLQNSLLQVLTPAELQALNATLAKLQTRADALAGDDGA